MAVRSTRVLGQVDRVTTGALVATRSAVGPPVVTPPPPTKPSKGGCSPVAAMQHPVLAVRHLRARRRTTR